MRLLLVRHTEVADADGLCYGHHDVPLRCGWRNDVAAVTARLPWTITNAIPIRSSPSSRCLRLAEHLSKAYQVDPRLHELHFGAWENRPWKALPRDAIERWAQDIAHFAPPGGECLTELAARADEALDEVLTMPIERAVFITHSGVIRALIAQIIGLPLVQSIRLHIAFGGLCEVEISGPMRRLLSLNQ